MKKPASPETAWARFVRTGRVQDYLACRQAENAAPPQTAVEEPHATDHQRVDRERAAHG